MNNIKIKHISDPKKITYKNGRPVGHHIDTDIAYVVGQERTQLNGHNAPNTKEISYCHKLVIDKIKTASWLLTTKPRFFSQPDISSMLSPDMALHFQKSVSTKITGPLPSFTTDNACDMLPAMHTNTEI